MVGISGSQGSFGLKIRDEISEKMPLILDEKEGGALDSYCI